MTSDELYMTRCLELAEKGLGKVSPNPLVGSVIVHNNEIIGEGYHQFFGGPHAEVNAINSVPKGKQRLLPESTLYVNLEPCSHHGKTPPCSDLIIEKNIGKVIVANTDPNPLVSGGGIDKIRSAGIPVETGILEQEGKLLNRRFITYHKKKRPYVILKWAQTKDGYFSKSDNVQHWITGADAKKLVHKWRSEEDGIMIGTNTAMIDNPQLTNRFWGEKQPIRVLIDEALSIPNTYHVYNSAAKTIIFNGNASKTINEYLELVQVDFDSNLIPSILDSLFEKHIQSLIVEGGNMLLNSFLDKNLWDEARVLSAPISWAAGIKAPVIAHNPRKNYSTGVDQVNIYFND